MLTPAYTRQFEHDTKQMKKRGKNLDKLKIIIRSIVAQEPIDAIHRDHKLIGNWKGRWECHIESDWLLIYMVESDRVVFERTGTHSDYRKFVIDTKNKIFQAINCGMVLK